MQTVLLSAFAWFFSLLPGAFFPQGLLAVEAADGAGREPLQAQPAEPGLRPDRKQRAELPSIIQWGESVSIAENQVVESVFVVNGDVEIQGEVRDAVIVLGGNVTVTGTLNKGALVVGGDLDVKGQGRLREPVVILGGELSAEDESRVRLKNLVIPDSWFAPIQGVVNWVKEGPFKLRPLPPSVTWVWYVLAAILTAYAGLLVLLPKPAVACMAVLVDRPVLSYFLGMATLFGLLLLTPVILIFACTGIGFLVLSLLGGCLLIVLGVGRIGTLQFLGYMTVRAVGANVMDRPWLALGVGTLLAVLLYTVPVIGALTWLALCPLTVGSLLLAGYRGLVPSSRKDGEQNPVSSPPIMPRAAAQTEAGAAPPPSTAIPTFQSSSPASTAPRSMLDVMERRPAGFWHRSLATFLDLIIVALLLALCNVHGFRYFLLALMAYHIVFWGWWGTTLGGKVLGLQLLQLNGTAPNPLIAAVRCLAAFFSALPLFLGFVWAGWNSNKESWHDKLTGTRVVRSP